MIKDILTDIVAHTHSLGFLPLVKITNEDDCSVIESMAEDRSVILSAKTHNPVDSFVGTFGMPDLDKLNLLLKSPEYKENATIDVVVNNRNGEEIPTGLRFENEDKDFVNDFRFMSTQLINEKLKSVKFKGSSWNIEFTPSISSTQRLKLQAQVHNEVSFFKVKVENKNLMFSFGDASTHAGEFIFQPQVEGKLKQEWTWPIQQVLSILNLNGDMTMKISDQGAMMIVVDSGIAEYQYILPAQTK
ncbi:MAG: hypothetical protein EBS49_07285 [Verrucomicrobia bacterium]|nr:hypothetical protein [Verrucomicrobiota bacterium]